MPSIKRLVGDQYSYEVVIRQYFNLFRQISPRYKSCLFWFIPWRFISQSFGFCWFRCITPDQSSDQSLDQFLVVGSNFWLTIWSKQWVEVQNWFGLLITPLPSLSIPRHFKLIYFGIKITSTQDGEVIPKKRIPDRKKCLMKNLLNQDDSHLINFHIPDQPNWVKIKNSFMWSVFV